jgi:hypothetical protein
MTLPEDPHGGALDVDPRGPLQGRGQLFIGPMRSLELTTLGTVFDPRLDSGCQRLRKTTWLARRPLDLSPCHAPCMIVLQPQPHRRTMHAHILGNHLTLPPPMRHQDRLTPVTEASVVGGVEDLFQVRLFCGRQPDPLHLFHPLLCIPPLVKTSHKGPSKKMQDQPLHVLDIIGFNESSVSSGHRM